MVHDVTKLRHRYVKSSAFKLDVISLLPTDLVFLISYEYYVVIARLNRVLRIGRLWELFERTESSTSSPNSFRIGVLVFYLLTAIHWNACFYFLMSSYNGFGSDGWVYPDINETLYPRNATLLKMYTYRSLFACPPPRSSPAPASFLYQDALCIMICLSICIPAWCRRRQPPRRIQLGSGISMRNSIRRHPEFNAYFLVQRYL